MESLIMKYIVYSFKNAGIFNHKNRSFDVTEYGNIDVPNGTLYVNHVYNMLAVMFGERPIKSFKTPSNNGINLKYIDKIYEMASNSFVEIKSLQDYDDSKGNNYTFETITLTKFSPTKNSWSRPRFNITLDGELMEIKSVAPSWTSMELFISNKTKFNELCEHIKRITRIENLKSFSMINIIEKLNVIKDDELKKFFEINKFTNLINLIYYPKRKSFTWHQNNWGNSPEIHRCFITKDVAKIQRIEGDIFVPVIDEIFTFNGLQNGTGFSTLLEGGVVEFKGINEYWNPENYNVKQVFHKEF